LLRSSNVAGLDAGALFMIGSKTASVLPLAMFQTQFVTV
jgi:hypothetical protein